MRRSIPQNHVTHDYEKVLEEFVSQLKSMLGDATDKSNQGGQGHESWKNIKGNS